MAKSLFLIILFIVESNQNEVDVELRITNGASAHVTQFPYMASILRDGEHLCGGTIIGMRTVLTAAHCCFENNSVVIGDSHLGISVGSLFWKGGNKYQVLNKTLHENFVLGRTGNDIALLMTSEIIQIGPDVQIIKLNPIPYDDTMQLQCVVCGWGFRMEQGRLLEGTSHILQYVNVTTIPLGECDIEMSKVVDISVYNGYICVLAGEGKGTCNGDSGGPLVYKGSQIGLLSFGLSCKNDKPELYTRIADYYAWIKGTNIKMKAYQKTNLL